ncbi:hypothetical protein NMY22_g3340 [Coprinellus aureogranulatus]|nr:hypothetical protein NMY22_g3340 [Coprinellus aureogranulatus]
MPGNVDEESSCAQGERHDTRRQGPRTLLFPNFKALVGRGGIVRGRHWMAKGITGAVCTCYACRELRLGLGLGHVGGPSVAGNGRNEFGGVRGSLSVFFHLIEYGQPAAQGNLGCLGYRAIVFRRSTLGVDAQQSYLVALCVPLQSSQRLRPVVSSDLWSCAIPGLGVNGQSNGASTLPSGLWHPTLDVPRWAVVSQLDADLFTRMLGINSVFALCLQTGGCRTMQTSPSIRTIPDITVNLPQGLVDGDVPRSGTGGIERGVSNAHHLAKSTLNPGEMR